MPTPAMKHVSLHSFQTSTPIFEDSTWNQHIFHSLQPHPIRCMD